MMKPEKGSPSARPVPDLPGVYGITGGGVNLFLLETGKGELALIDAGMPGAGRQVSKLLSGLGLALNAIKYILITHADLDHVGDLKSLAEATGARVYASGDAAAFHRRRQTPPHLRFPYKALAGLANMFMLKVGQIDQMVADGDVLDIAGGIRVMASPGHTPDHISYYCEREKVLFAGDLFRNLEGTLTLTPTPITWNMEAARQSAIRALDLHPSAICPGHGQVWTADRQGEQAAALYEKLTHP